MHSMGQLTIEVSAKIVLVLLIGFSFIPDVRWAGSFSRIGSLYFSHSTPYLSVAQIVCTHTNNSCHEQPI